jgi:hypothetical protein
MRRRLVFLCVFAVGSVACSGTTSDPTITGDDAITVASFDLCLPGLAQTLVRVSALLTTGTLRNLNGQVEGGSDAAAVARAWLAEHDLTDQDEARE